MIQKSIKCPARFLGLHKSSNLAERAMSATWRGQNGHIKFAPTDLLKQELHMQRRALSINAPATAKSHVAGYPILRANWARQLQSPLPNWKLYVSSLGKTLSASYVTKRNGELCGAVTGYRLLSDWHDDSLAQKVIK
jgi:hypothetical protein